MYSKDEVGAVAHRKKVRAHASRFCILTHVEKIYIYMYVTIVILDGCCPPALLMATNNL